MPLMLLLLFRYASSISMLIMLEIAATQEEKAETNYKNIEKLRFLGR